ncbi:hypothetical protein I3760_04G037200 [Carya illinoinensis]|nr:hypothetical protein I3760_04G037200 [Carya illinoinensis]KAG2710629.1 hypothetical protein I3760_04G037200 [Carya illinoinensis]
MDWDWNDFAWDSIEWEEKEDNSTLAGLVGPGSLGGQNNNSSSRGGIMVDLKLRGISDLEERSADGLEYRGPFKRTRVMSGTQNVSCSVDGCKSDLSICRDYHRRHRVCERHSKTPVVIVGGKEQRFCQQCSRFHSLGEFDDVKRSCRKRLDGHNLRRRKSQPEPLYLGSEEFRPSYKGSRILQFSNPHIYATTSLRGTWPGMASSEAQAMVHNHCRGLRITEGQSSQTTPEASIHQPLPNSIVSAESGRGGHSMLSGEPTQSIDLGCALYLLSTHPTQTSAMDLNHLVRSSVSHPSQSIDSAQQLDEVSQCSCSHGIKDKSAAGLVLLPDSNETNFYCNGVFQDAFDALFESEASRTLPIWWE